jgi:hypothetical protein
MKCEKYLLILCLHISDNSKKLGKTDKYCDKLWVLRTLADMPNDSFAKFYNLSEHLALDKVIVKFRRQVIFKEYLRSINVQASKFTSLVVL